MKYAIQVSYYMWSEVTETEYTEWLYLGTEGGLKIFVFDDEVNEQTKLFDTAIEAGQYVDKYFGADKQRCSFESVRIVEVKGE